MTVRGRWAASRRLLPADPYPRLTDLSRIVHREVVLLVVLSALSGAVFLLTQAAAGASRAQKELDASVWYERGRAALANKATPEAVDALRRAVVRQPDDWEYARTLAEAFAADGRIDAARQLLLRWRARQPDAADVSTHLARLEARDGDREEAVRYYESALNGRWEGDAATGRLALRRELIELLLREGETGAALSHVLTLAANVPDEPGPQAEVAGLFMLTGDPARALEHYQRVLRLVPADAAARAGAGAAAFALDEYTRALGYVRGLEDAPSRRIASITSAIGAFDPLRPRLSSAERERRLEAATGEATRQLGECRARSKAPTPLAERTGAALVEVLATFRRSLSPARLREAPEVLDRGLDLVGQAFDVVAAQCPPLDERGEALRRIARQHAVTP